MSARSSESSASGVSGKESFSHLRLLVLGGIIVAAGLGVYGNSLSGPFIFDDITSIPENSTIRSLWPIWEPLSPPAHGEAVQRRPLVSLSLALNYGLG